MLVVVCPFLFIQTWWGTFSALHIEASFWCNFSNFSLKIPFLNYCKAITLHICIFPYVIVISSKKIFFLRRMLYLIHTSSLQQTICQYQTTASVGLFFSGSCFRHVIGRVCCWESLLCLPQCCNCACSESITSVWLINYSIQSFFQQQKTDLVV